MPLKTGFFSQIITRRAESRYGKGRSRTAWITLKMAVLAPTPRAVARTAAAINPGLRRKVRRAKRRSASIFLRPLWHAGAARGEMVSGPGVFPTGTSVCETRRSRAPGAIDYDFLR